MENIETYKYEDEKIYDSTRNDRLSVDSLVFSFVKSTDVSTLWLLFTVLLLDDQNKGLPLHRGFFEEMLTQHQIQCSHRKEFHTTKQHLRENDNSISGTYLIFSMLPVIIHRYYGEVSG